MIRIYAAMIAILMTLSSAAYATEAPTSSAYILGPGDTLSIEIVTRDDLSSEQKVAPDGSIYLPLLERQLVAGQSLAEFQAQIKEAYKAYLKTPLLKITLTPKPIFVVQHDLGTKTFEVKNAYSVPEAMSYGGGQLDDHHVQHGEIYHVKVGQKPTFLQKNWYK